MFTLDPTYAAMGNDTFAPDPSSQGVVSPELALVDPALRRAAVTLLPPIEPYGFLWFPPVPSRRRPPLLVRALVYAAVDMAQLLALAAVAILALVLVIVALNLVG